MFEEEAEEYANNTRIKDKNTYISFPGESISEVQDIEGNYIDISERIIKTFKDASEFGYNKANEWHYVKDGDFPEEEKEYLIYTKKKKLEIRKIHISGDGKNYLTDVFLMRDLESVIAWKEIVLPKEIKEND